MRFFQASYGKPDNINWKLFNLSPGIPQDMCDFFEKVGTRNAPQNLNPQDMRDEAGNPLLLREICSQDCLMCLDKYPICPAISFTGVPDSKRFVARLCLSE